MRQFTHMDENGCVRMVDVSAKKLTTRTAVARGTIQMRGETFEKIANNQITKGNVLETARIAGIMAAKKTAALIPMCHPLNISHAKIDFELNAEIHAIGITAEMKVIGQTGIEIEALTAVSVAALTIYDMCKAVDREMVISDIFLQKKSGGKSGTFTRE